MNPVAQVNSLGCCCELRAANVALVGGLRRFASLHNREMIWAAGCATGPRRRDEGKLSKQTLAANLHFETNLRAGRLECKKALWRARLCALAFATKATKATTKATLTHALDGGQAIAPAVNNDIWPLLTSEILLAAHFCASQLWSLNEVGFERDRTAGAAL